MKIFSSIFILFLFSIFSIPATSQKSEVSGKVENTFLQKLVGNWIGKGTSFSIDEKGKRKEIEVEDEMILEPALDGKFLKLQYRALTGDKYKGEGFIRFNAEKNQFEYYEFNNGIWAARRATGKVVKNSLIFDEKRSDIRLQLTFEIIERNTLKINEIEIANGKNRPVANLIFKRKP